MRHLLQHARGGGVGQLLRELKYRDRLLARVRACLPEGLRRHCVQAVLEAGTLTLAAESPVWATKLRLLAPEIPECLRATGLRNIGVIRVRVLPQSPMSAPLDHPPPTLSRTARQHLEQAASAMPDPLLAEILTRIARAERGD